MKLAVSGGPAAVVCSAKSPSAWYHPACTLQVGLPTNNMVLRFLSLLQWAAEQAELYEVAYGSDAAVDSDSDYERSSKRRKQTAKKGKSTPVCSRVMCCKIWQRTSCSSPAKCLLLWPRHDPAADSKGLTHLFGSKWSATNAPVLQTKECAGLAAVSTPRKGVLGGGCLC